MDPGRISKELRLRPSRSWKVGEPRRTPKGEPIGGINRDSYWLKSLVKKRYAGSRAQSLERFLKLTIARLEPHSTTFRRIKKGGGHVELFIGLFSEAPNHGAELPAELLLALGRAGVGLSLDIYR